MQDDSRLTADPSKGEGSELVGVDHTKTDKDYKDQGLIPVILTSVDDDDKKVVVWMKPPQSQKQLDNVLSGLKKSIACTAANNSIARTVLVFSEILRVLSLNSEPVCPLFSLQPLSQ